MPDQGDNGGHEHDGHHHGSPPALALLARLINLRDVANILRRVLPVPWLHRLARLHGLLVYLLSAERRRTVAGNLAPFASDDAELKRMTRRFFELRQVRVLMMVLFLELDPSRWDEHLRIDGLEHLDRALAEGRGVILLGSHINSIGLFMAIMMLRRRGYDVGVALPSDKELYPSTVVGRLIRAGRPAPTLKELLGGFYVQFNVRPIVRKLAANGIIGQTGDGWHSVSFAPVPFLGRKLPLTTGMLSVAQSTGAMVVTANVLGDAPRLSCVLGEPFRVPKGENPDADLVDALTTYAATLDRDLRANLLSWEHWLIPDTLDTMESWPDRPLKERYEL